MTYYTVLGCTTDIEGALPYMCPPASNTHAAVELWYLTACENIGVNPDAMPPASAEHEALIDAAYSLRRHEQAFLDGEALVLHRFELGGA